MKDPLVVVPCGQGKIWDKKPDIGPVPARDVYTGAPFKVNREYAERFAGRWVILSAKYGFIDPDFIIEGPYNVTFKKKATGPVAFSVLRDQVHTQGLFQYDPIIGLGGKEYRAAIETAFASRPVNLLFPFSGLPIGLAMQAVKKAIQEGNPF